MFQEARKTNEATNETKIRQLDSPLRRYLGTAFDTFLPDLFSKIQSYTNIDLTPAFLLFTIKPIAIFYKHHL